MTICHDAGPEDGDCFICEKPVTIEDLLVACFDGEHAHIECLLLKRAEVQKSALNS